MCDNAQDVLVPLTRQAAGCDQRLDIDAFAELATTDVEAGRVRALLFLRRECRLEPRHAIGRPICEQQHLRQLRNAAGLNGPRHAAAEPHEPAGIHHGGIPA